MTISSDINKSGPFACNGVTIDFPGDFSISDNRFVSVILADPDGVETVLELDADYAVIGAGEPNFSVTITPAPALGHTITLIRNVPFTQEVDLENQGAYLAEVVEAAFDAAVARDQQLKELIDRSVKIPASSDLGDLDGLVADIVQLGDRAHAIETVAAIAPNVSTVAGVASAVTAVAAVAQAVSSVGAAASEVTAVAGNLSSISAVAANAANINAANGHAAAASASASAAALSAAAAAASAATTTPVADQINTATMASFISTDQIPARRVSGNQLIKWEWGSILTTVSAYVWSVLGALVNGGAANAPIQDNDLLITVDASDSNTAKKTPASSLFAYIQLNANNFYLQLTNLATAANFRANAPNKYLDTTGVWTAADQVTLTDAATITVDLSTFINATVTLGGNRTLGNPVNEKTGQSGYIRIVQDATGGRTLAYGTDWEFENGVAPVLPAAPNSQSLLFYQVIGNDRVFASLAGNIS